MTADYHDLDRTDRSILHEVQLNGRITNSQLAEIVNLSESACLRRVRALEESGILRGYVALIDQSSAGFPDNVFVTITLQSQQQSGETPDAILAAEVVVAISPELVDH